MVSKALPWFLRIFSHIGPRIKFPAPAAPLPAEELARVSPRIGLIAGNGTFPLRFCEGAKSYGCEVVAVCHLDETPQEIEQLAAKTTWIKVGELGRLIDTFKAEGIRYVAMAGGINRVRLFGGVKLDIRGALLLARLRSTKDDMIMRGIAAELASEGIEVVDSVIFMRQFMGPEGVLVGRDLSTDEEHDVQVGVAALKAMSGQDIGQLVVVKDGVVVAVEAVEGSDAAIRRGGKLSGPGAVVVKYSKPTQDLRFDVPVIGKRTIESLVEAGARVLAYEAGRCIILDHEEVIAGATRHGITLIGCPSLQRSE